MKNLIHFCIVFVLLSLVISCGVSPNETPISSSTSTPKPELKPKLTPNSALLSSVTYWPTEGWRSSTPEEQGMDSEKLAQIFEVITEQRLNIHSVLIIRNGYLVTEAYYHPFRSKNMHEVYSVTKSVVSALVGIALEKGFIESVHQPVLDFFPEQTIENDDAHKQAITLEHLLTMTSGLEWTEGDTGRQLWQNIDWAQFVLNRPMAVEPGTQFNYNSGNTHLLSVIIQETTGMSTLSFAQAHLFEPLGISDVLWSRDPSGISIGGWGLRMTPCDMAKLGYLYLNNGVWDGQQVVPADWVNASIQKHVQVTDPLEPWELHLGYSWWLHEFGPYAAHGMRGQFIYVIPDLNMVVVFTSGLDEEAEFVQPELLIRDFIMPAAISSEPLPENPEGVALLESLITEAKQR
jgi:CubicO group peptidase (beta-lactamase class C family)